MESISLWGFLALSTPFVMTMVIVAIFTDHRQKMKKLQIEALKVQEANLHNEVNDAVERDLSKVLSRIEVLEAIVTDKKYDLDEKITRLNK